MFYLLLLYLSITLLCLWAGLVFYSLFQAIGKIPFNSASQRPLTFYLLSGLILITCAGQWIVLICPLGPSVLIYFIIPLLVILSFFLKRSLAVRCKNLLTGRLRHPFFLPCFILFLLLILILNAGPTIMDDTDSYHIQMVKWVQEYGTVPGIANLHLRFGFNSSWFLSIALLIPQIRHIDSYMALNGLLSCWLAYYLLYKIFSVFANAHPSPSDGLPPSRPDAPLSVNTFYAVIVLLIISMVAWPMLRGNAASANYDFISTCCLIVLFIEAGSSDKGTFLPEWLVWPLYLFTIKQSNYLLSLLPLILLIRSFRDFKTRTWITYIVTGSLILFPFFIRNVLLSGYLLYPFYQIDLFSVDWKVSKPLVIELMDYIKYFNRSNGEQQQVAGLPFTSWIPIWHRNLAIYDKILTDLSLLCWILIGVRWKKLTAFSLPYRLFLLAMFGMLLAWLLFAPDPRFIYGALLAGIFTFFLTLPPLSSWAKCRRLTGIVLLLFSGITLIYTARKVITDPQYRNWMLPRSLPVPATQKLMVDGIQLQIPDKVLNNWNPRCYDLELPCLYVPNPFLRARGGKIRDGFRVEKDAIEGENKIR